MNSERFLRISNKQTFINPERRNRRATALFDWFKRNLDYETFLANNSLRYTIKQGEVYEIDFGRNVGSELNERHYAVVLHDSNELAQNIVVVPLTTKIHHSYTDILELGKLEGIKTNDVSYAKISQIRTIDKARIYLRHLINIETNKPTDNVIGPVTVLTEEQFRMVVKGLSDLVNNRCNI